MTPPPSAARAGLQSAAAAEFPGESTAQGDKAAAFNLHSQPGRSDSRRRAASGRFGFLQEAVSFAEINGMFK
jgi:hypothetical protein